MRHASFFELGSLQLWSPSDFGRGIFHSKMQYKKARYESHLIFFSAKKANMVLMKH